MIIVLGIVLFAVLLFVTEWLPIEVTALVVMVLLMLTGIVTPEEGISGFSNIGTLSVFTLLMLSIGLESTGIVNLLANKLEKLMTKSEFSNLAVISTISGISSAFLNNTAVVAILLPVVTRLAHLTDSSPSKYLMPLSFAAMAGGCITLIGTSTNLIVSGIYTDRFGESFGIFEFSLVGIAVFVVYLLYILFIGRFILPSHSQKGSLTKEYLLDDYLTQVTVSEKSPLIGEAINIDFHPKYGIRVLEIIRENETVYVPQQVERIQANDIMSIKCPVQTLMEMQSKWGLHINRDTILDDRELTSEHAVLFEAVVGNNSQLINKKVKHVDFRRLYNVIPLAIRKSGSSLSFKISEVNMQFGDTILMEGRRKNVDKLFSSPDFIVLEKVKKPNYRKRHMLMATLIVLGVIFTASMGWLNIIVAAFTGVALLFVTGCVSPSYVYKHMDWKIVLLLAGMIPLGIAVEKTGLSQYLADYLLILFDQADPLIMVGALFLVTVILTSFISNNATAILFAPIAISLAQGMNIDPKPLLLAVMIGASVSFLTPIGYQTNTLIYGPGKYKFVDYIKVGGLLTIFIGLVVTFMIDWLYF